MDYFFSVLNTIPESYQPIIGGIILVVYYGFPKFRELRKEKRYFDARTKVLEYKKLLYEVESIRKERNMVDISDTALDELIEVAERLQPSRKEGLPPLKRFYYGTIGSAVFFFFFLVGFFWAGMNKGPVSTYIPGAIVIAFLAGVPTIIYKADKYYKSILFGAGSGLLIALLIGALSGG